MLRTCNGSPVGAICGNNRGWERLTGRTGRIFFSRQFQFSVSGELEKCRFTARWNIEDSFFCFSRSCHLDFFNIQSISNSWFLEWKFPPRIFRIYFDRISLVPFLRLHNFENCLSIYSFNVIRWFVKDRSSLNRANIEDEKRSEMLFAIRYVPDYEIDIAVRRVIRYLIASSLLRPRIKSQSLAGLEKEGERGKRKKGIKRLELCQLLATLNRFLIDRWNEPSKSDPLAAIRREKPLFSFFLPLATNDPNARRRGLNTKFKNKLSKLKFYYSHSTKEEKSVSRIFYFPSFRIAYSSNPLNTNKYANEY